MASSCKLLWSVIAPCYEFSASCSEPILYIPTFLLSRNMSLDPKETPVTWPTAKCRRGGERGVICFRKTIPLVCLVCLRCGRKQDGPKLATHFATWVKYPRFHMDIFFSVFLIFLAKLSVGKSVFFFHQRDDRWVFWRAPPTTTLLQGGMWRLPCLLHRGTRTCWFIATCWVYLQIQLQKMFFF